VLMEKSPRHAMMTTYLQEIFGPDRTFFIVLLRHPLATIRQVCELACKCRATYVPDMGDDEEARV
jgi:hypothetical protein